MTPPARTPAIKVVLRAGDRLQIGADASPALVQAVLTRLPRRMLTLSPAVRIYLATRATDLRRSIDGLAGARALHARPALRAPPPLSQSARRPDQDPHVGPGGFWVLYKRLERGTFAWPTDEDVARVELRSADLLLVLTGVDLVQARRRRWYERARMRMVKTARPLSYADERAVRSGRTR